MTRDWPTVTVVVVNLDGRDYLDACLGSLFRLDYPADRVEVVVVDNGSTDGSVELVQERFPQAQLIRNATNTGFAPAVNQGARAGRGELLALINNDAVADPGWLRELVEPLVTYEHVACTGGLVLDASGESVDYAGGAAAFNGHAFPLGHGEPPSDDLAQGPTLFATGASLATRRQLFLDVGGFDDDYFAFFEDVDYGWRLWVLGYEVWFVPASRLYHRHHGTIERFGYPRERYLLERNALATIFKNQSDETLARTLPAATILTVLRGVLGEDNGLGDYRIGASTEAIPTPTITPLAGAHLAAIRDFGLDLGRLADKRAFVQERRVRPDREVLRLLRAPLMANIPDPDYVAVFDGFVAAFNLLTYATARQRVLIVCADKLGAKMAGPAIRSWEMASLVSREHEVVLGSPTRPEATHDRFAVEHLTPDRMRQRAAWAEVIVVQGVTMWQYPEIGASSAAIVVDLYDPFHIEALELRRDQHPEERWSTARSDVAVIEQQLRRGDLFLCASGKQRDFWLGHLAAAGRINPATYDEDADLAGLLKIAPFGLPPDPPEQQRHGIKGTVAGIGRDDIVLLWGGGIYNWFDPATLIRAVAKAAGDEPRLKLFFLGTAHPNPDVPAMMRAAEAYKVAEELGVLGRHVFFNDGWVDYDQRADYLLDADVGCSTHFLHIETELSFRTRILDYVWAGLPIVCTEGDSLSTFVQEHDLGEVVAAEDVDALAAALLRVADPDRHAQVRANVQALAPTLTWEQALAPLIEFCRLPRRAPDLAGVRTAFVRGVARPPTRTLGELFERFAIVTREKGVSTAFRRGTDRLRRSLRRG